MTDGPAVAAARGLAGGSRHMREAHCELLNRRIVNCLIAPPRNILTYLLTYLHVNNSTVPDNANRTDAGNCGASPIQYSFIKKMTKRT